MNEKKAVSKLFRNIIKLLDHHLCKRNGLWTNDY